VIVGQKRHYLPQMTRDHGTTPKSARAKRSKRGDFLGLRGEFPLLTRDHGQRTLPP
jgi:hypothetical protein